MFKKNVSLPCQGELSAGLRGLRLVLIFILYFIFLPKPIYAKNVFGLHLTQTSDINTAYSIINSTNGDWGWATIVIRTDQLDKNTWQEFFDNCRKHHIIPIVRIATKMENNNWIKPEISDIDNIANFLNSLNWPSLQQHVTLFNEVNHGQEWGGGVDVKNFVDIAIYTADKLKALNPNFYILTPGLDLAAPEKPPTFKNYENFYQEIKLYKPEYFEKFDAMANHYYPHNSANNYKNELVYFPNKDIPVFITETAIPHRKGFNKNNRLYTLNTSTEILKNFILKNQDNQQIKAITPFIYNYPHPPFDNFSWLDKNENLYPQFQKIIDIPKKQNQPKQITSYNEIKHEIPLIIFTNKEYYGHVYLKNTGQSIWGETNFCLKSESKNIITEDICTDNSLVFPNQTKIFSFKFKVNNPKNFKEEIYLKWENLPEIKIMPINSSSTIYRQKTNLWNRFLKQIRITLGPYRIN